MDGRICKFPYLTPDTDTDTDSEWMNGMSARSLVVDPFQFAELGKPKQWGRWGFYREIAGRLGGLGRKLGMGACGTGEVFGSEVGDVSRVHVRVRVL